MPTMTPVATQIQPPNPQQGIGILSGILGLQQKRIGIEQQQQELIGQTAEAQQAQQRNTELQQAQQLALSAKSGNYRTADGSLDRLKLASDISALGPYAMQDAGQFISQANEIVANQQAHQNLSVSEQRQMGSTFGALAQNPGLTRSDIINGVDELLSANQSPDMRRLGLSMMAHLPANATPQQLQNLMRQWSVAATSPENAAAQSGYDTTMVQGPKGLVPTNVNPRAPGGVGPVGAPQEQGLAPTVVGNPLTGAPTVIGALSPGAAGAPGGGAPQSNASSAYPRLNTMNPYPGEQADLAGFQKYVAQVRQEGDQAPLMHNINQNILQLSENAKTGPGSPIWQHIIGALGAPFGLSPTANYQEVGKFLEKNAIQNMQAMGGPPSDARLSAAAAANGGPEFSPKALRYVTEFNNATVSALEMYRQGLDKAVGTVGPNYLATPEFRAAWAKNFDIRVFELQNALQAKDEPAVKRVLSGLTKSQAQALKQKWANLQMLSETGALK